MLPYFVGRIVVIASATLYVAVRYHEYRKVPGALLASGGIQFDFYVAKACRSRLFGRMLCNRYS